MSIPKCLQPECVYLEGGPKHDTVGIICEGHRIVIRRDGAVWVEYLRTERRTGLGMSVFQFVEPATVNAAE